MLLAFSVTQAFASNSTHRNGMDNKGRYEANQHHGLQGIWQNDLQVTRLGLSQEQVEQLKVIDFDLREKQLDLRTNIKKIHLQVKQGLSQENVDEPTFHEWVRKVGNLQIDIVRQEVEAFDGAEKIFNLKQLKTLMANYGPDHKKAGHGQGSRSGHERKSHYTSENHRNNN